MPSERCYLRGLVFMAVGMSVQLGVVRRRSEEATCSAKVSTSRIRPATMKMSPIPVSASAG